jgi:hypothetical protein
MDSLNEERDDLAVRATKETWQLVTQMFAPPLE